MTLTLPPVSVRQRTQRQRGTSFKRGRLQGQVLHRKAGEVDRGAAARRRGQPQGEVLHRRRRGRWIAAKRRDGRGWRATARRMDATTNPSRNITSAALNTSFDPFE